ncbi:copper homeostasis protein CutC [Neobacillus sp. DY30]|uniref:copper homeostasis protein CutC n=1 Tax=Neobacillus sp. DY30 TaxID=3047871 RepID=UPI0024C0E15C|nr:copper homeostasis protein CutC [Neobacillus sp. DY30]WHY00016.1 copper homeostasis protein CutC [Neobacillus sp. DY30]
MLIEFIAVTVEDAKLIERSGADRIELVSGLTEGGITPSYGLIEKVVNSVNIPVNVMVRPHAQSFCYSEDDITIMKNDIRIIRSIGANGVVFGVLDNKGDVDFRRVEELLTEVGTMEVTFHRAIDSSNNIMKAAQKIDQYKEITTILTSGGYGDWETRLETLRKMKETCTNTHILIGSGLSKDNIRQVHTQAATNHYHFGTAIRNENSILKSVSLEKAIEIVHTLK